jgi:thiamine kinase-like enzyme
MNASSPSIPSIQDWPFNRGELTAGLRRHTGDPSLRIESLEANDLQDTRPGLGRLRGLHVTAEGTLGAQQFNLVVKQAQNRARAGIVQNGIREVSVYAHLADHLPMRVPPVYAYQPDGEWLVMGALPSERDQKHWTAAEYLLAIDQLVALHDRFWGLSEFLEVYRWLRRPLEGDLDVYQQAAESGLLALNRETAGNRISSDTDLLTAIEETLAALPELSEELHSIPATLLHGDYWPGNIHVHKDGSLTVLDWEQTAIGPGILDLVSFLQNSHWFLDPLPLSDEEMIEHYRMRLRAANGQHWPDADWARQWDAAQQWAFVAGWVDLLATIPDAVLDERLPEMDRLLFTPFKEANARYQGRTTS